MTDPIVVSAPVGDRGKNLTFETGQLAQLADGAVLARLGDTVVLTTAVSSKGVREGIDFFPLTVDVEERMYAVGKIPGSFFRREGRPSEQAILTCRLTDRPLRPSFPKGFRNETQVVTTVLGADLENPHDVLSINAASAALMVSGIPFAGPIGAVRLAHHEGAWLAHPTYQEGDASTFELVVAGRRADDGTIAVMMVEAGGTEASWELYEGGGAQGDRGGHRRRPRGGEALDQRLDRVAAPAPRPGRGAQGPDPADGVRDPGGLHRRGLRRGGRSRPGRRRRGHGGRRQARAQQPARRARSRGHRQAGGHTPKAPASSTPGW